MSANKQLQIKDLTPSTKGQFVLNFEVAQVIMRNQAADTLSCRIVDQTGIINAYFERYAKFINQGSVFEIKNFRCKVVDHHLRLQMIKDTVISKKPLKICFRDMDNDLSEKFYVAANKNNEVPQQQKGKQQTKQEAKKVQKKESIQKEKRDNKQQEQVQTTEVKRRKATYNYKEKEVEKNEKVEKVEKGDKNGQNQNRVKSNRYERQQRRYAEKKIVQKQDEADNKKQPNNNKRQEKETNNYRQRKWSQKNNNNNQSKARERRQQQPVKSKQVKTKYIQKIPEIKIDQMPDHQELQATFFAYLNLKTKINKENYFLCKVSDQTGSTYFEFDHKLGKHLQDQSWYKFIGFKVYGDRDYGFIACQQSNSSYQLLENYAQKERSNKLLWR